MWQTDFTYFTGGRLSHLPSQIRPAIEFCGRYGTMLLKHRALHLTQKAMMIVRGQQVMVILIRAG